jgi:hypothetical protein
VPDKELRFPARFDDEWWEVDLARTTPAGQKAAEEARDKYESDRIPRKDLRPCEAEAQDGTNLDRCFKVYLPPPAGRFGMVFRPEVVDRRISLRYLGFGVRHHPPDSHAETVYRIAHRRLHEKRS